jgi:hypothetical protein
MRSSQPSIVQEATPVKRKLLLHAFAPIAAALALTLGAPIARAADN